MCKYAKVETVSYQKYNRGITIINLTEISPNSFNYPDAIILRDIEEYGWAMFRGIGTGDDTQTEINNIANKGR